MPRGWCGSDKAGNWPQSELDQPELTLLIAKKELHFQEVLWIWPLYISTMIGRSSRFKIGYKGWGPSVKICSTESCYAPFCQHSVVAFVELMLCYMLKYILMKLQQEQFLYECHPFSSGPCNIVCEPHLTSVNRCVCLDWWIEVSVTCSPMYRKHWLIYQTSNPKI